MGGQEKIRVLIVDDHELMRKGIFRILSAEKNIAVVGEASDGQTAIQMARELRPTVVLMDIHMPDMDGLAATRQIKQLPSPPKVLFVTQYDGEEYVRAASGVGGDGVLSKKFLGSDLAKAIQTVVDGGKITLVGG